jgi:hypothetical protein
MKSEDILFSQAELLDTLYPDRIVKKVLYN